MVQGLEPRNPHWRFRRSACLPALDQPNYDDCSHLCSKPMDPRSFYVSLFLTLSTKNKGFFKFFIRSSTCLVQNLPHCVPCVVSQHKSIKCPEKLRRKYCHDSTKKKPSPKSKALLFPFLPP